uniref:CXXC-type domain-containing protein n=1 Tax=Terrapene triunguis TaxID=2587831 RepID=A0A674JVV4_9SAUR
RSSEWVPWPALPPNGEKFRSKIELTRFLGPSQDLTNFDFKNGVLREPPPKVPGGVCVCVCQNPRAHHQPGGPQTWDLSSPPLPSRCCASCQNYFPGVMLPSQRRSHRRLGPMRVGCGACQACQIPEDCGICTVCAVRAKNPELRIGRKCLLRRCLKIVKKGFGCGVCQGCQATEDCGSCYICLRRLKPGLKRQWKCLKRRCLKKKVGGGAAGGGGGSSGGVGGGEPRGAGSPDSWVLSWLWQGRNVRAAPWTGSLCVSLSHSFLSLLRSFFPCRFPALRTGPPPSPSSPQGVGVSSGEHFWDTAPPPAGLEKGRGAWEPGLLGSLPALRGECGLVVRAGGWEPGLLGSLPALGGEWGLVVRAGCWEPGLVGSLPALGGEWGLVVRAGERGGVGCLCRGVPWGGGPWRLWVGSALALSCQPVCAAVSCEHLFSSFSVSARTAWPLNLGAVRD